MQLKKKVCFIAVIELSVKVFLVEHMKAVAPYFDISVAVNTKDKGFLKSFGLDPTVIAVPIERKISPLMDLRVLLQFYRLFRKNGFHVVHSIMPKSGLLSMIAGFVARVPVRVHTFTGQVWATKKGAARWFLKSLDKLIAACATHILADSHSQRTFLIQEGVITPEKSSVIADGSICGVDEQRFSPDIKARHEIRKRFAIPESDTIFLFLGRMNRDKGLLDLAKAFGKVAQLYGSAHLLVVGPDEEQIKDQMLEICQSCSRTIHFETFTEYPEHYMAAADVFCLPSYREGFGMTVIEAASVGIPAIGTRIYGITDAIEEDITGFLYKPGNIKELVEKMQLMIERPDMRKKMGKQSRERVMKSFSKELVTSAFVNYYNALFTTK